MIRKQSTRQLFESKGPGRFVREMYGYMGLDPNTLKPFRDKFGNAELRSPKDSKGGAMDRLRPDEFSLRNLAESIIGDDWHTQLNPDAVQRIALMESLGHTPLLEASTGAVNATAFANINAFTAVVSGLLEVSIMEAWKSPQFIADQLMPPTDTRMFDGRKVIGTTRIGDQAEERLPGNPTKRVQFGERWIVQPRTVENALACEVTQEAVFLDLTGEVLEQANGVGEWLGYRKDLRCIDAFIGVTNTYNYKGNAYNTYLTSGFYTNSLTGNELVHWSNFQTAEIAFRDMTDPDTGTRVMIQPNTVLVNREKLYTAQSILNATNVQYRDAPGSTTNAQQIREFPNPIRQYTILESPLVYQHCTDTDGLALSASNAGKLWFLFEKGKAFKYATNWPLRTQQAAPNQVDMIDRGVVLYVKADERGVPMVYEPRRMLKNAA